MSQKTLYGKSFQEITFNKGDDYEKTIHEILKSAEVCPIDAQRGRGGNTRDCVFIHQGKLYCLEVKDGPSIDYGQKMLRWSRHNGWEWAKDDELTRLYTKIGVLEYLNKKNLVPIRYTKKPIKTITYNDRKKDQNDFEDKFDVPNDDILSIFYGLKNVHYIQIGKGYGFYHLDSDPAGLQVDKFLPNFYIRFRAKAIHYLPPWNYEFFAVIKLKISPKSVKPARSKYNLEGGPGQDFPKIVP